MPADLVPNESSLPELSMAPLLLCVHMALPLLEGAERASELHGGSSHKDTYPVVSGLHSYAIVSFNYFLIPNSAALVRASICEFGAHIHSVHNMQ